jgi:hypothetical protein
LRHLITINFIADNPALCAVVPVRVASSSR